MIEEVLERLGLPILGRVEVKDVMDRSDVPWVMDASDGEGLGGAQVCVQTKNRKTEP